MPETPELRSFIMRQIKSKDTRPEMAVRRLVFGMGYRYRLHRKTLPGRPDLAFIARKKAIFVNGCFWHGHDCPAGRRVPRTNRGFWVAKIARNRERDAESLSRLDALGWQALTLWECELADADTLRRRVVEFLGAAGAAPAPGLQRDGRSEGGAVDEGAGNVGVNNRQPVGHEGRSDAGAVDEDVAGSG